MRSYGVKFPIPGVDLPNIAALLGSFPVKFPKVGVLFRNITAMLRIIGVVFPNMIAIFGNLSVKFLCPCVDLRHESRLTPVRKPAREQGRNTVLDTFYRECYALADARAFAKF